VNKDCFAHRKLVKHSNPDSSKDDDEALIGKIGNLNDEIDSINSTRSPPFSLDLLRASKVNNFKMRI
jgi:hypothetical protein